MKTKLYFLCPNLTITIQLVKELHAIKITDDNIHIVGNDHAKLQKAQLHEATIWQTTDLIPSLGLGATVGAIVGSISGALLMHYPLLCLDLGYMTLIGMFFFGTAFGAWISSMVGMSLPAPIIERFQESLDQGEYLIIIDIKSQEKDKLLEDIAHKYPQVFATKD